MHHDAALPAAVPAAASVNDLDARLATVLDTAVTDGAALGSLLAALTESERGRAFERLRERVGLGEASRIWLQAFAASDAAPT